MGSTVRNSRTPGANRSPDSVAPTTARTQADSFPAPKRATPEQTQQAAKAGRERINELNSFKEKETAQGRLKVQYEDLENVTIENGAFTKGTLASHHYDEATGISTVTINSRAQAAALNSSQGSTLRKQFQLAELHELAHAQNAIGLGRQAGRGRGGFLEEMGVHRDEFNMEVALHGSNPSHKSVNRSMYEKFGDEGIANQLISQKGYQKQFEITSVGQARELLNSFGLRLFLTPSF